MLMVMRDIRFITFICMLHKLIVILILFEKINIQIRLLSQLGKLL
jgi:hypothetical protein